MSFNKDVFLFFPCLTTQPELVDAPATNAAQHSQYRAVSNKFFRDNHKSRRHLQVCFCLLAISVQENLANQFLYALFASYSFNHWSFVWQEMLLFFVIVSQRKCNLHVKSCIVPQQKARCIILLHRLSFKFAACSAWHLQKRRESAEVTAPACHSWSTSCCPALSSRVCEIELNLNGGKYWDPTPYLLIKSDHCIVRSCALQINKLIAIAYTNHYNLFSSINY